MKRTGLFLLLLGPLWVGTAPMEKTQVVLEASVEPKRVPLNRTTTLTVRLSYRDVLNRITVQRIEDPILTNFEVIGTSASHQRTATDSAHVAVQTFVYVLRPKTLGMGYVEAGVLTYHDATTGETSRLMTPRIGVEVVDPVPEPRRKAFPWIGGGVGIALLLGLAVFFFIWKRRHTPEPQAVPEVSLEEKYLSELKSTLPFTPQDRSGALSELIRLYRRYLAEKYGIPAREATTAELIETLRGIDMEERLKGKSVTLFEKADAIRFSGREVTLPEWEEAYTTVETVLETLLKKGNAEASSAPPSVG